MEQLEAILNHIRGGVILCNFDSTTQSSEVIYINNGWTDIMGYTLEELNSEKGGNPQALVFSEDKINVDIQYSEQIKCDGKYELMYRIVHKNGTLRWVIDKGSVTPLSNGHFQNQSIITEMTALKEQEERLRLLAQTDQLTDINNKVTFTLRAQSILERQWEKCHAMLLLDIDHFKGINDTYGHAFGDKVLEAVAAKMKELFRSRDVLGRIGGDEFLMLMTDITDTQIAIEKAEELRCAISAMKIPGKTHIPITVSIGIAFFTGDQTYNSLFEATDTALYCAKKQGRNQLALEPTVT